MTTNNAAKTIQTRTADILQQERLTFQRLAALEKQLNDSFHDMHEAVYALILSILTGEPLLFVGPPGTGKSMLIHMLCHCLKLYDLEKPGDPHDKFFEYLLTPFTEPTELFGHYNIEEAARGKPLERIEKNMMRPATVVYLDEVFNGSSAILNSILAFMNERVVHDRGERKPAKWEFFFAATNRRPEAKELEAIYDRFVLRCWVDNISLSATDATYTATDNLRKLVAVGWNQTYGRHIAKGAFEDLLIRLPGLRDRIKEITHNDGGENLKPELMAPGFFETLATVIEHARDFDLSDMSNRRIVKMTYVLFAHRLYQTSQQSGGTCLLRPEDLRLVGRYFLDNVDDRQGVQTLNGLVSRHSGGA